MKNTHSASRFFVFYAKQKINLTWPNGKKHPYYGKSMGKNFPGFPIQGVLLPFPMLWETDEKTHASLV